jgi:pimeloyl-ACP methyl ester carboxylesterase
LLVPGHTSRVEEYERVIAALRGRFRVLSFDFPGCGYSDKPDRAYDLAYYDRVLVGFLDALGVGECFLAGGSLGGNLVLRAALARPARFPRVVAWAPGSSWPAKPFMAWCMRRFGLALFHVVVRIQSTFWYSRGWKGRRRALRATFAYYAEVMCPGFVRMYWGIAADQVGSSLVPVADGIRQPVLLMWGDRDHGFAMGVGVRRLHARMPQSELVVFPGAGHALAAERSREIIARIAEFLSRPSPSR